MVSSREEHLAIQVLDVVHAAILQCHDGAGVALEQRGHSLSESHPKDDVTTKLMLQPARNMR
jgi:hypothetical protein